MKHPILLTALGAVMSVAPLAAAPLKVYLMAGQSNMQGYCGMNAEGHGKYYRMMIDHARSVLGDIKKVYPAYDSDEGYTLEGFVWFQAVMDEFLKTVYSPEEWKLMETGVSHACYHYLGSAKIMSRIGKSFADAMIGLSAPAGQ